MCREPVRVLYKEAVLGSPVEVLWRLLQYDSFMVTFFFFYIFFYLQ